MKIFINRSIPHNLEELKLINCKIHASTTYQLLETLNERSYIRKLALVKANLNEASIKVLVDYIRYQRFLIDLDISWNGLRP